MQETENPVIQEIKNIIIKLEFYNKLEAVRAIIPKGAKLFMERIHASSKYLSHLRKIIYDVEFENVYYHNGKVPENCFVIDNQILRIENQATIEQPDKFLEILNRIIPEPKGICFYLDDVLYLQNVQSSKSDGIRNLILNQRHDGLILFDVLKIIDSSGNVTEFHASSAVKLKMQVAKATNPMLI